MLSQPARARHYVVVGGGISGLAAAHRLSELDPHARLTLLEANNRLGGVIQTVRRDGFLYERSADSFITTVPWAINLARRIGFEDQLIGTNPDGRRAMVVHQGRLEEIPAGFVLMAPRDLQAVLKTPILSWAGKLRLAWEAFEPPQANAGDESVAAFAKRRLGVEVFERLVQPLVGGIYTADPEKLSLAATLPRFQEMERTAGSLTRAAWKERAKQNLQGSPSCESGARYSMFVTPREGLSSFINAIADRLPAESIRLNTPVTSVARSGSGRWSVSLHDRDEPLEADGLVLAAPAPRVAPMLTDLDASLASEIGSIEHAGSSVCTAAYRTDQIARLPRCFGFVVPSIENRQILSASFSSHKFAGRAPDGYVVIRTFIGGALQAELNNLPDSALRRLVSRELQELIGVEGSPVFWDVSRYAETMPQYHLGHLDRVSRIESRVSRHVGLAVAGNAYRGVGIPQCIQSGESAAQQVAQAFGITK